MCQAFYRKQPVSKASIHCKTCLITINTIKFTICLSLGPTVFCRLRNFEPSRGICHLSQNFNIFAEFEKWPVTSKIVGMMSDTVITTISLISCHLHSLMTEHFGCSVAGKDNRKVIFLSIRNIIITFNTNTCVLCAIPCTPTWLQTSVELVWSWSSHTMAWSSSELKPPTVQCAEFLHGLIICAVLTQDRQHPVTHQQQQMSWNSNTSPTYNYIKFSKHL